MDKARNYVTRVSRKSDVFVSYSGVFGVTRRSDSESKDFTMKNINFIRRAYLSVPVVGNHSVSEETPSPPKVGTYIWVKQIFMFSSISMLLSTFFLQKCSSLQSLKGQT